MAEPLKLQFGVAIPKQLADQLYAVSSSFDRRVFVADALKGYEAAGLMARAGLIADALQRHLPTPFTKGLRLLMKSLGPKLDETENNGMAPFFYLPHGLYVARYGLEHFDESMQAQYELTQRFTAEFSIRPFIERYPAQTLSLIKVWARDPNVHVRRLVSEGTRPRLPWASRLRGFQQNPRPVLELLELLKDDSELYVRRSVANNLNDIGKDHPEVLTRIARRWLQDASPQRQWIIHHALRSAIKRGEPDALAVAGFGHKVQLSVSNFSATPKRPRIGDGINMTFDLTNAAKKPQNVLVDLRIHFIKSNGRSQPKVFKLKRLSMAVGSSARISKRITLAELTTRKHYPGVHRVDIVLNGTPQALGHFELRPAR